MNRLDGMVAGRGRVGSSVTRVRIRAYHNTFRFRNRNDMLHSWQRNHVPYVTISDKMVHLLFLCYSTLRSFFPWFPCWQTRQGLKGSPRLTGGKWRHRLEPKVRAGRFVIFTLQSQTLRPVDAWSGGRPRSTEGQQNLHALDCTKHTIQPSLMLHSSHLSLSEE